MHMNRLIFFCLACLHFSGNAQILAPMQGTQRQPKLQFDYWVYSTNAGNGTTSQYPIIPTNKTEMDNLFNSSNSNTTLTKSARTNSAKILD